MINSQKLINDNSNKNLFKKIYKLDFEGGRFQIYDVNSWDGNNVEIINEPRDVSLSIGTREMAEKTVAIAHLEASSYGNLTDEEFKSWDRTIANVIYNFKTIFRPLTTEWAVKFTDNIYQYSNTQRNTNLIISLSSACATIISCLVIIPFIFKAQSNVTKVINIFLRIPQDEYLNLIKSANEYIIISNKHFVYIKEQFYNINFKELGKQEQEEELGKELNLSSKRKSKINKDDSLDPLNPDLNDDEEAQNNIMLASQLEEIEFKRKENNIASSSTKSRNLFTMGIIGIVIMITIYFVVTIIINLSYFNKINSLLAVVEVIIRRKPTLSGLCFYVKEDFSTNHINFQNGNHLFCSGTLL